MRDGRARGKDAGGQREKRQRQKPRSQKRDLGHPASFRCSIPHTKPLNSLHHDFRIRKPFDAVGNCVAASGVGEEAVADAADGGEVGGVGGVVLDVAAEADDEVVDGAGVGVGVEAPDLLEDG